MLLFVVVEIEDEIVLEWREKFVGNNWGSTAVTPPTLTTTVNVNVD